MLTYIFNKYKLITIIKNFRAKRFLPNNASKKTLEMIMIQKQNIYLGIKITQKI
jgi:hypothetical protein